MKRKRIDWDRVPWTPFHVVPGEHPDPDLQALIGRDQPPTVLVNSRYQVSVFEGHSIEYGPMVHLSIKTHDKTARHDWRDLQRIKNEICGRECEAVELYPAESRLVDTANQYHLFVFRDYKFPFGFHERLVGDGAWRNSRQRAWTLEDRPPDCLSPAEFEIKLQQALKGHS